MIPVPCPALRAPGPVKHDDDDPIGKVKALGIFLGKKKKRVAGELHSCIAFFFLFFFTTSRRRSNN